jgi:mRNA interferase RelE/StbE
MYNVVLLSKAEKYYSKCDKTTAKRLEKCFESMETDPFAYGTVKPLYGKFQGLYRARIGDLRVIFKVDEENITIYIIDIAPRGDVYK